MKNICETYFHEPELTEKNCRIDIYQAAYIHLTDWTSSRSFGRFWHLYWNSRSGAQVIFNGKIHALNSRYVYLIPGHTLFATRLDRPVNHFYIDFTIADSPCFENVCRQIYQFPSEYLRKNLSLFMKAEDNHRRQVMLHALIWNYLSQIPSSDYEITPEKKFDPRIARAIEIMETQISSIRNIEDVCRKVKMSINNFYLLFKKETNKTPLMFLTQMRLGRASYLLEHTEESIDEIASEVGFADRYHFSKRFKQLTSSTPIEYRRSSREPHYVFQRPEEKYCSRFLEDSET